MNYTEILDTAFAYADRADDVEALARKDFFLRTVENRLNNRLKVRKMSARTQLLTRTGVEYYGLPSDFAGLRDIELVATANARNRYTLQYLIPEQMNNWSTNTNGNDSCPVNTYFYTIIGNQLHIMNPTEGMLLEIVYYQEVPPLTALATENWVSLKQPNLYIFGLMVEINSFAKDKEATMLWDKRFLQEVAVLDTDDRLTRWSGTPLQTRVDG